ncbi:MAG: 30S ribosomal protein S17 [Candidatus Levybacteria bacterium]|nr:30S ribosomal protein S17 [Candidatus Levybacteria bacterium]
MKIFEGIVVSIGMNKTAVVEVSRRTPHPLYRKLIRRSKKIKADVADFNPVVGNQVKIVETRPISKDKYFKIMSITGVKQVKKIIEPTDELESSIKVKKPAITENTEKSTETQKRTKVSSKPTRKTKTVSKKTKGETNS